MEPKQFVLGIVIFVVFWAFQAGYLSSLGTAAWFLGAIIFVVLLFAIGKFAMPKPPPDVAELWKFAYIFGLVVTFIISFLGQYIGAVLPADMNQLTPMVLSIWLVVFGAAIFATGRAAKLGTPTAIGLIWLFSALHFVTAVSTGPNSYLHFAIVTGFSFIVAGLVTSGAKKQ